MKFSIVVVLLGAGLGLLGCGGADEDGTSCATGAEGCACFPNDTCNSPLSCKSNLCVDLFDGSMAGAQAAGSHASAGLGGEGGVAGAAGSAGSTGTGNCRPQCGDRECGPDPVCGDLCGSCNAGLECVAGICKSAQPLKTNGETCSHDTDCASDNCGESVVGEAHCYGTARSNEVCADTFDCAAGICIPQTLEGVGRVCVEGLATCEALDVQGTCHEALAIASCQYRQSCGDPVSDFDRCIDFSCDYWPKNISAADCPGQVNYMINVAACD